MVELVANDVLFIFQSIIRVGFPGVIDHILETENTATQVAEMLHHFVPEVQVLPYTIFGDKIASCLKEPGISEEQGPIPEKWTPVSVDSSHSLRPEGVCSDAPMTLKMNEGDMEDTASAISVAPDSFWLALIEKEASSLLNLICSNVDRGSILLVGYGFGGIVIKKVSTRTSSRRIRPFLTHPRQLFLQIQTASTMSLRLKSTD